MTAHFTSVVATLGGVPLPGVHGIAWDIDGPREPGGFAYLFGRTVSAYECEAEIEITSPRAGTAPTPNRAARRAAARNQRRARYAAGQR